MRAIWAKHNTVWTPADINRANYRIGCRVDDRNSAASIIIRVDKLSVPTDGNTRGSAGVDGIDNRIA
jgi:hypothetical protein